MTKNWNAPRYASDFHFVADYGRSVTDLLTVPVGSRVIDLGCGTGTLTAVLRQRGYRVLGIDASADMLDQARREHPQLTFQQGDACTFRLDTPADAIFSNAVFHWIPDQQALVRNLATNLRPGGQLVFEFGGRGCGETVHRALATAFAEAGLAYHHPFSFRSIGEFAPLLEQNGFAVQYATLFDRPTVQSGGAQGLQNWIEMFVTAPFDGIAADTRARIVQRAVALCRPTLWQGDHWIIDYVRLRMQAVRTQ